MRRRATLLRRPYASTSPPDYLRRCQRYFLIIFRYLCLAIFFLRHFLTEPISFTSFLVHSSRGLPVADQAYLAVIPQGQFVGTWLQRRSGDLHIPPDQRLLDPLIDIDDPRVL